MEKALRGPLCSMSLLGYHTVMTYVLGKNLVISFFLYKMKRPRLFEYHLFSGSNVDTPQLHLSLQRWTNGNEYYKKCFMPRLAWDNRNECGLLSPRWAYIRGFWVDVIYEKWKRFGTCTGSLHIRNHITCQIAFAKIYLVLAILKSAVKWLFTE